MDEQATVSGGAHVTFRKPRVDQWTAAKRQIFLEHLLLTCSVTKSVAAVGMTMPGAHKLRSRDAAFAAAWAEALAQGYQQIEAQLLERALGNWGGNGSEDARPFDPELGLRVLQMRNAALKPHRADAHSRVTRAPIEQVEASLRRKLDALAKHLKEDS